MQATSVRAARDQFWLRVIYIVSGVVTLAIVFLIWGPRPEGTRGSLDVSFLPTLNAGLNALSASLLVVGYLFIRRRLIAQHRFCMLSAFGSSTLFLTSYTVYHWYKSGPASYAGSWPGFYYTILISHILLAAIILPLALITLYRGWTSQLPRHRRIARITLPLWLYVSVTGVLIYWMLYGSG